MKLKASQIKPNPDNPRLIKDHKFMKLVKSLKDFPEMADVREVVINKDYMILGGNMRYKAMLEAGWKEVPVRIVDWPEDKQREFIIKDNVAGGEWDWDIIANQWDASLLDDWGVDLPSGFGEEEVIEDEAPPVADVAVSKLGEIYQLGRHRLMCGDSTDFGSVSDLMDGAEADMVLTDPPYGIDLETNYAKRNTPRDKYHNGLGQKYGTGGNYSKVIGDDKPYEPSHLFEQFQEVKEMFLWGGDYYINKLPEGGSWYVWDKRAGGFEGVKFTSSEFELCWSRQKHLREILRVTWFGAMGTQNQDTAKRSHPTQKPLQVNSFFIGKFSKEDNKIVDLFGGSGSTLIACEQLDRTCYMMELDPKYCYVIRKRYWKFVNNNNETGCDKNTPVITERAPNNGK